MKKISIILALTLTLVISLTGCGGNNKSTDIKASSEITSSDAVSSDVADSILSSTPTSSKQSSFKETSSKATSSKATSSKSVAAKTSPTRKALSNQASSKPTSSYKTAPSSPASSVLQESSEFSASVIEQKLFVLVNEERARLGLSKLSWSNTLYKSAKIRSDEIAAANVDLGISHTRPNGTTWSTTLKEVNYSEYYAYAGENLAAVQQRMNSGNTSSNDELANIIFDGWKNSKGHYEAIIRPETKEIGIAVSRNASDVYATQHFGQIE